MLIAPTTLFCAQVLIYKGDRVTEVSAMLLTVIPKARDEPLRDKGGALGFVQEAEARRSEKFGPELLLGFLRERQDRTGYTA